VSCYRYRRHRTLWRQWWIWPSSLSPLLWNLTTVHGIVTAKILFTDSEVSTNSYFVAFIPDFSATQIIERKLYKQTVSSTLRCLNVFHWQHLISVLHYINFICQCILYNILYTKLFLPLQHLDILHTVYIYHSLDAALIHMYFKTHCVRSVHLLTTFVLLRCTDPLWRTSQRLATWLPKHVAVIQCIYNILVHLCPFVCFTYQI
jgi:hypothetical protein